MKVREQDRTFVCLRNQTSQRIIDVESKPMTDASFQLSLPIGNCKTAVKKPALSRQSMATLPSRRTPTVLVVEDEESMLSVLEKILVKHGYKVLKASDGELAVRIYQREKASIDVVFLNMGLP